MVRSKVLDKSLERVTRGNLHRPLDSDGGERGALAIKTRGAKFVQTIQ